MKATFIFISLLSSVAAVAVFFGFLLLFDYFFYTSPGLGTTVVLHETQLRIIVMGVGVGIFVGIVWGLCRRYIS